MDQIGVRNQAMREYLRPIYPCKPFCGWARTIACSDVYHLPADPYAMEIEAIDSIQAGEIVVVSTQQSKRNAPWGELLSTAAKARGARGAVIDGLVRDVRKIEELEFPVLAAGVKPVDSMGRGIVTGYNVPVECGEVLVNPGDFVFADFDGVVVVPKAYTREVVDVGTGQGEPRRQLAVRAVGRGLSPRRLSPPWGPLTGSSFLHSLSRQISQSKILSTVREVTEC